jgi:hypothetical protein
MAIEFDVAEAEIVAQPMVVEFEADALVQKSSLMSPSILLKSKNSLSLSSPLTKTMQNRFGSLTHLLSSGHRETTVLAP